MLSFCSLADENQEESHKDWPWAGVERAVRALVGAGFLLSGFCVSARTTGSAEELPLPKGGPGSFGSLSFGGGW